MFPVFVGKDTTNQMQEQQRKKMKINFETFFINISTNYIR